MHFPSPEKACLNTLNLWSFENFIIFTTLNFRAQAACHSNPIALQLSHPGPCTGHSASFQWFLRLVKQTVRTAGYIGLQHCRILPINQSLKCLSHVSRGILRSTVRVVHQSQTQNPNPHSIIKSLTETIFVFLFLFPLPRGVAKLLIVLLPSQTTIGLTCEERCERIGCRIHNKLVVLQKNLAAKVLGISRLCVAVLIASWLLLLCLLLCSCSCSCVKKRCLLWQQHQRTERCSATFSGNWCRP